MGMSSYVMDSEDRFVDVVSSHIGSCETIDELNAKLLEERAFGNIVHMSGIEQKELVGELWNEYWSNYV